jgi:glyoxylase-like metal-dependent hydrolase (beta-lactamase superfamily II)
MEHLCFFSKELNMFISGDQLLPTISSHVGTFPTEPAANPVEDWISSCHKLIEKLPEDVLVLPAHGRPFIGAHKRLMLLSIIMSNHWKNYMLFLKPQNERLMFLMSYSKGK